MNTAKQRIVTVPNMLSLLRLALIPLFVGCYVNGAHGATALLLVLSGLSDVLDGWYARRFGAVSDLGKALDPAADKLTQAAMLAMLVSTHPQMLLPLLLLVIKELTAAVLGLLVIRRTGEVPFALWHGKLTTLLLYGLMFTHVVWKDIPPVLSNTMTGICVLMMIYSMAAYTADNIRRIRKNSPGGNGHDEPAA